jgi:gamma-glutamylcyclotransferase
MDYFAYGTNLSKKQMKERCPDAKPKFTAVLPNYQLIFTGWSRILKGATASIKPMRGQRVLGAVWDISENDSRRLDRYEDYPGIYNRINVMVIKEDGTSQQAFTYIKRVQGEEGKPSPEYLTAIKQGYVDWGIE